MYLKKSKKYQFFEWSNFRGFEFSRQHIHQQFWLFLWRKSNKLAKVASDLLESPHKLSKNDG